MAEPMIRPKPPHSHWQVTTGGQTSVIAEWLSCVQVWRWLTRAQRSAVLAGGVGHPRVVATLRARGLVSDDGLTPAGELVRKWHTEVSS